MDIKDIRLINGIAYLEKKDGTVFEKYLPISLRKCEEKIETIRYTPYRDALDEEGVEKTQFPPIIFPFYNTIFCKGWIPYVPTLLAAYYEMYSDEILVNGETVTFQGQTFRKRDVDGRILRTYPSLLRDFHFYLTLVKEDCFDEVCYSCQTDITGKDIVIRHNDYEYEISLFANTKRSRKFKGIKNQYRHTYGKEIQLSLNMNKAKKCGNIFVYGEEEVEIIKNEIRAYEAEAIKVNYPGKPIGAWELGDRIKGYYFLRTPELAKTSGGSTYLRGELLDKSGVVDLRVWDYDGNLGSNDNAKVVYVEGTVKEYREKLQIEACHILLSTDCNSTG